MKHKKEDYQFFNLAVGMPWLHTILLSLTAMLWRPRSAIESLLDLEWSFRRVGMILLATVLIVGLVDAVLLVISPNWKGVSVFSPEYLWHDAWWIGALKVLQVSLGLFVKYLICSGLIFWLFKLLKRSTEFINLLWWSIISIVVWDIYFDVFNFSLLFGRELIPVTKPYTQYVYLAGMFYAFCLQVVSLAVTTKSRLIVSFLILAGFQVLVLLSALLFAFLASQGDVSPYY